jgi:hypothetical protein
MVDTLGKGEYARIGQMVTPRSVMSRYALSDRF